MVKHFQVNDRWLYVLLEDGTLARKYLLMKDSPYERIELPPEEKDLVEPKQSNAGGVKFEITNERRSDKDI
jgi:hypothetical protein